MKIEEFQQEILEKGIDFSRGHIAAYFHKKRYKISRVEWSQINQNKIKIYLVSHLQSSSTIKILQDLKLLSDTLLELSKLKKKELTNDVYFKIFEKEFLVKFVRINQNNVILEF